ncbi:MAG: chromate transporter [Burkholderiaceae bacterium]|nr:chromate transporter [Burkholderiaceae bacterium]
MSGFWAQWLDLHGHGLADLLALTGHFALLSLLAVGGAITTAPDMQRWLVAERGWLGASDFGAAVAIAQAAPGPNILFVALVGFYTAGLAGAAATMGGMLLPSSALALVMGRYGRRQAQSLAMRAFTTGMTPVTLGLLLATGVVLVLPEGLGALQQPGLLAQRWPQLALAAATVLLMLRGKLNPLWPIAAGALAGLAGWA